MGGVVAWTLVGLGGVTAFNRLPIDAVPDITNVQVQINTEAPGYSPLEVEQRMTFPIETGDGRPAAAVNTRARCRAMGCPGHRRVQGRHGHLLRAPTGERAHRSR